MLGVVVDLPPKVHPAHLPTAGLDTGVLPVVVLHEEVNFGIKELPAYVLTLHTPGKVSGVLVFNKCIKITACFQ